MSNDPYQQRQFFEDNSKAFKLSNGWEFKATTLSFDKEKVTLVVMRGIVTDNSSDEERSNEIKQLGKAYRKIKKHGKNI